MALILISRPLLLQSFPCGAKRVAAYVSLVLDCAEPTAWEVCVAGTGLPLCSSLSLHIHLCCSWEGSCRLAGVTPWGSLAPLRPLIEFWHHLLLRPDRPIKDKMNKKRSLHSFAKA